MAFVDGSGPAERDGWDDEAEAVAAVACLAAQVVRDADHGCACRPAAGRNVGPASLT